MMEIVLVTKTRSIGMDEDSSGLSDLEYLSLLPGYQNSVGVISSASLSMLSARRKEEIKNSALECVYIQNKRLFLSQDEEFYIYKIKNINPVLYETPGYNCIINFKNDDYRGLKSLRSFLFKDNNFDDQDFNALEQNANYLICSYYEGEAAFIYTVDRLVQKIIDDFNELSVKKCGLKITIEILRGE